MKSKHKQHMFNSAADTFNIFLFSSDADTKTGISQDMFTKLTNALDRHLYKFIVLFQLNLLRILCPKNIIINSTCIQRHALMPTAVNTANLAETHRQHRAQLHAANLLYNSQSYSLHTAHNVHNGSVYLHWDQSLILSPDTKSSVWDLINTRNVK